MTWRLSQCHNNFVHKGREKNIAIYFPQPLWNVLRLHSGTKGEGTLCVARAHEGVAIYCASDKKQALILLLWDRGLPQTSQARGPQGLIGPGQAGRQAVLQPCGGELRGEAPLFWRQPPHVCLCGGGELPCVEPRLWGDDCYSTGVGFKKAFLMGGNAFHRRELRALGKPGDEAAVGRRRRKALHRWEQPAICWRNGEQQSGWAEVGRLYLYRRRFGERRSCLSSFNERKYLKASRHNASNEPKMYMYFLFYLFGVFEGVTRNLNNWVKSTCHASPPWLPLRSLSTHTCKQTRCTCRRPCNCGCKVA